MPALLCVMCGVWCGVLYAKVVGLRVGCGSVRVSSYRGDFAIHNRCFLGSVKMWRYYHAAAGSHLAGWLRFGDLVANACGWVGVGEGGGRTLRMRREPLLCLCVCKERVARNIRARCAR